MAIILSHNHPNGSPEPSAADKAAEPVAQGSLVLVDRAHLGLHHRGGRCHHVLCRIRPDLIDGTPLF
ncbi:JAB domain-containing protein [Ralstonia pseudosolanacearum]